MYISIKIAKNNSKENNKKVLFAVIIVLLVVAAIYAFNNFYNFPQFAPEPTNLSCGGSTLPINVKGTCQRYESGGIISSEIDVCGRYTFYSQACWLIAHQQFDDDIEYCKDPAKSACFQKQINFNNRFSCPSSSPICPSEVDPCQKDLIRTGCLDTEVQGSFGNYWHLSYTHLGEFPDVKWKTCKYVCYVTGSPTVTSKGTAQVTCGSCNGH